MTFVVLTKTSHLAVWTLWHLADLIGIEKALEWQHRSFGQNMSDDGTFYVNDN